MTDTTTPNGVLEGAAHAVQALRSYPMDGPGELAHTMRFAIYVIEALVKRSALLEARIEEVNALHDKHLALHADSYAALKASAEKNLSDAFAIVTRKNAA